MLAIEADQQAFGLLQPCRRPIVSRISLSTLEADEDPDLTRLQHVEITQDLLPELLCAWSLSVEQPSIAAKIVATSAFNMSSRKSRPSCIYESFQMIELCGKGKPQDGENDRAMALAIIPHHHDTRARGCNTHRRLQSHPEPEVSVPSMHKSPETTCIDNPTLAHFA